MKFKSFPRKVPLIYKNIYALRQVTRIFPGHP
jgi:hypothetical protein